MYYIISFKKVYRLMRENRLLFASRRIRGNSNGRRPARPQQNRHVEIWHSIIERSICERIELESLEHARGVIADIIDFYNNDRIHSGIAYKSPRQYLLDKGIDLNMLRFHPAHNQRPKVEFRSS